MDDQLIESLYTQIGELIDGKDRETVLLVIGMLYSDCALQFTHEEEAIRELFEKMSNATMLIANLEDGCNELQAEENPSQKAPGKATRKTTGNEPGPSGLN